MHHRIYRYGPPRRADGLLLAPGQSITFHVLTSAIPGGFGFSSAGFMVVNGVIYSSTADIDNGSNQYHNVPEPATGLLMLLGVGGAALRRRVATL